MRKCSKHLRTTNHTTYKGGNMTKDSITDFDLVINKRIDDSEELAEILSKIEALLKITLNDDFLDQEKLTIHNYFWVIFDLLLQAKKINKKIISEVLVT
jgi:hypothetical protein